MRALTTLVAAAAALALLAGCGGDDEETTSSTSTTETTPTAATSPTGPEGTEEADPPAATGGADGDGSGGGAPQGAGSDPEGALKAFFTSGDPDVVCGELATPELLASAYGDERGCRQAQLPGAVPRSIEIKELETDGDETEAVIVPEGGPNDGFDHDVVLIREGDTWLVDSIEADIPAGP